MMRRICATTILVLLLAMTPVAADYAVAEVAVGPPVPAWDNKEVPVPFDAVLYETTENLNLRALKKQERRKATSALLGFARKGSALCPEALVLAAKLGADFCTLNATGSDNISLETGLGTFNGDVEVTVQEVVDKTTGQITPDSPEVVIAKGRFSGKMDFSPAIVGVPDGNGGTMKLPLGTVEGFLSLDRFAKMVPFQGVFRLPFLLPPVAGQLCVDPNDPLKFDPNAPLYIVDLETFVGSPPFGVACVANNEMAIGYPTVRFEISFQ